MHMKRKLRIISSSMFVGMHTLIIHSFSPEGGLPMHDNTCTVLSLTLTSISSHN